jgi:hypothetical protein
MLVRKFWAFPGMCAGARRGKNRRGGNRWIYGFLPPFFFVQAAKVKPLKQGK